MTNLFVFTTNKMVDDMRTASGTPTITEPLLASITQNHTRRVMYVAVATRVLWQLLWGVFITMSGLTVRLLQDLKLKVCYVELFRAIKECEIMPFSRLDHHNKPSSAWSRLRPSHQRPESRYH